MTDSPLIVALSTAGGVSPSATIRISGKNLKKHKSFAPFFQSHVQQCSLELPSWPTNIPLSTYAFKAPRSYTGEDVLEWHLPGHPTLVQDVLRWCQQAGCELARPGEFTRRALMNQRLSMAQAEQVLALIHARDAQGAQTAAQKLLYGHSPLSGLRETLLALCVRLEHELDFLEDELGLSDDELKQALLGIIDEVETYLQCQRQFEGACPLVVLGGPTRAGKSSLFNALLGQDLALTSDQGDTTLDWNEGRLVLGSQLVLLCDLPGVTSSTDPWMQQARRKSQDLEAVATLKIWCQAAAAEKQDVPPGWIPLTTRNDEGGDLNDPQAVSLKKPGTIRRFKQFLADQLEKQVAPEPYWEHHQGRLSELLQGLAELMQGVPDRVILCSELRRLASAFDELCHPLNHEEVLDKLFARFCVGK